MAPPVVWILTLIVCGSPAGVHQSHRRDIAGRIVEGHQYAARTGNCFGSAYLSGKSLGPLGEDGIGDHARACCELPHPTEQSRRRARCVEQQCLATREARSIA